MKMLAWSKLVPMVVFAAMLASACATSQTEGQGGGNPYGSGGSARAGGSAGSMSGGGSGGALP